MQNWQSDDWKYAIRLGLAHSDGLVFEAYDKYYRVTGDKDTAAYLLKALVALIAEF